MEPTAPFLHQAVSVLAAVCDGAQAEDGMGFNGTDTRFGRDLAATPPEHWTYRQAATAYKMLRKYKGQLAAWGVDYDAIPEPVPPQRRIGWDDDKSTWYLVCEKNDTLLEAIRALPSRTWDRDSRVWRIAPTHENAKALSDLAKAFAFAWSESAQAHLSEALTPPAPEQPVATDLPVGKAVKRATPSRQERRIVREGSHFVLYFPYDPDLVTKVKALPNRRFNQEKKAWLVPVAHGNAAPLVRFAKENGFSAPQDVVDTLRQLVADTETLRAGSTAAESSVEVAGLGKTLRPFQKAGVAYAALAKRTFIGDDMGLGKTVEALATIQHLGAFPALIVCPANVKISWQRHADDWLMGARKSIVLSGRLPDVPQEEGAFLASGPSKQEFAQYRKAQAEYDEAVKEGARLLGGADIVIVNYDIFASWLPAILRIGWAAFIADESHRLKGYKTQRTLAAKTLVKEQAVPVRLFLTGTPIKNRNEEWISQLDILGRLDELGGFWKFAERYCGAVRGPYGLVMGDSTHGEELNAKMREICYIRRLKRDVTPELPEKQRAIVPVELSNRREYAFAEEDFIAWLVSAEGLAAAQKAQYAQAIVKVAKLRALAAEGKMLSAIEWIETFLESGEKLVVFAYHRSVVEKIKAHFKCPTIMGGDNAKSRQAGIDAFQTDESVRLIACNIVAGGEGVTLTAASNVLFLELDWTPTALDQCEDRCNRIGQKNAVTAWYLLGEDSIDEVMYGLVNAKRAVVAASTEGEKAAETKILTEIMARYSARAESLSAKGA